MKKISIISTIILLGSITAFAQAGACGLFKLGKFLYRNETNELVKVERKKNRQIEINTSNNQKIKHKIVWINECSFKMYAPGVHKNEIPPAIVNLSPKTDSTFTSTCSCGMTYTSTWIIYDSTKFNRYKASNETF